MAEMSQNVQYVGLWHHATFITLCYKRAGSDKRRAAFHYRPWSML